MKKLEKITGDTWFSPGMCAVGYSHGLLIDSGESVMRGQEVLDSLNEHSLKAKYMINTHSHVDHCGGNGVISDNGVCLLATEKQQFFLADKSLVASTSFGAVMHNDPVANKFEEARYGAADRIVEVGDLTLNDRSFLLESHEGHSLDHITITTPDDVMFVGDILLPEDMLEHIKIGFVYSLTQQINDLKALKATSHKYYVLAHGGGFSSIDKLVDSNLARIDENMDCIYNFCAEPKGREEITAYLIEAFHLRPSATKFLSLITPTGAYISHMCLFDKLKPIMIGGSLKYVKI